jgi:hypothetical protein
MKHTSRRHTASLPSLAVLLALSTAMHSSLRAQADSLRPVTGQNPTQVVSQFQPYIIIQSLSDGVTGYSVVPAGTLALGPRLQVQVQLPYVFRTAGDAGGTAVSGFGDPQWEVILAAPVRGSKVVRLELALGGFIKVAPPDRGNGAWIMQPTVGASFNISKRVQLITVMTYQYSFGADSGVAPTSSLLGQVFALWQPISHTYIILQVNPGIDLIGDTFVHNTQLQFGRFLNKEHTIGPWVQFALNTGEKNTIYPYSFQFQAGLSWLFPKHPKPQPSS